MHPRARRRPPARRDGFTLVEVTLALVILVVGVGGTLGSISSFAVLEQTNRETTLAHLGARRALEEMQAHEFRRVFALYNADATDDPAGVAAPGAGFAVDGLGIVDGDPDGLVGRIVFPVDGGGILREDLDDPGFGLPDDLNADGFQNGADIRSDYVALPVRVIVEWRGRAGNRTFELQSLLTAR
jgi:prepilin-type N-terminal cleavage/methylation domain-containing protein